MHTDHIGQTNSSRLAQSVEHQTLNLRVVGSSPTLGDVLQTRKKLTTTADYLFIVKETDSSKKNGSGGIRTHASEETGALNQRLRPLGHATSRFLQPVRSNACY